MLISMLSKYNKSLQLLMNNSMIFFRGYNNAFYWYIVCDNETWTQIHAEQFPTAVKYLKVNGTKIDYLHRDAFYKKTILVLDISDNSNITGIDTEAFNGLDSLVALRIKNSRLQIKNNKSRSFFYPFRHLTRLTRLILEQNGMVLEYVDFK